ncbi:cyclohexanone monooxygenase [Brevibacillus choshinensis]|uniref:Cyclohexanone monooxygenase n=1 Tax=Brevibacillus choshinensis TaxID=54911 RepID=A0ABR5NDD7_BRECH|nr:NAD(P)/FAD-dependent oxidoreductase [Brevibacillus choshinensis]KQL49575.1 cyclohexanone monooxygenase [Brevibacillus choshinensis]
MTTLQKKDANQLVTYDAVIVGAGFAGLYMLNRLREAGLSTLVYEAGDGVGGVWYWNRYPGARCDSESIYYNYTFSEELYQEWTWSSRYPGQPEILQYLNFVADKFDLRRDIQFETRVVSAHYDETQTKWCIQTDDGASVWATYFISAVGCLSAANVPKLKGIESFQGEWYHTGNWPHEKVEFTGKRVGVIGTGSSGIQSIPVIAEEAAHLMVFQRTPQYSSPARNHDLDEEYVQSAKQRFQEIKQAMRESAIGFPIKRSEQSALEVTEEERQQAYESAWQKGGLIFTSTFQDLMVNGEANDTLCEFIRTKIKETVQDEKIAEMLLPSYYFATKRPVLDTHYFETFNRDNVTLVNVRKEPIIEITPKGLRTEEAEYELDILVFATGYDAMTGPLLKMDIRGKNGLSLKEKWAEGARVKTYLGITTAGFPNMFMITGPESPSVLSNMPVSIEQHVEWIADCIQYLRDHGKDCIEPKSDAEEAWSKHCWDVADSTLFTKAESWYTGANIKEKPVGFPIYLGGVGNYRQICTDIAAKGYEGFTLQGVTENGQVQSS